MSFEVVRLVYSKVIGSAHRKAVLAYCADRANKDGTGIWCSKQTIADEAEISRSTVIKVINEFVAEGILIQTGKRKCSSGATIEYCINLEAISSLPDTVKREENAVRQPDPMPSASRTPSAAPVRQPDPMPSASRTQTVLEPSIIKLADANLDRERDPTPKKPPRRSSAIPDGWVPSDRNLSDARDRNFTEDEINEQADAFRDYHLSKGSVFKDWDAAWRTWLGNASKFGRVAQARHPGNRSPHDGLFASFQRAALRN